MKKFIKNNIIGFILGAVIFSSITVAAYSVLANDIGYTPKDNTWKKANGEDITNVKDAIDELYGKANNSVLNIKISEFHSSRVSASSSASVTITDLTPNKSYKAIVMRNVGARSDSYVMGFFSSWNSVSVSNVSSYSKGETDFVVNFVPTSSSVTFTIQPWGDYSNWPANSEIIAFLLN